MKRYYAAMVLGLGVMVAGRVSGEDIRYPLDMGIVNLTQPPYNADASGRVDATAAIQKALDDHCLGDNWTLYLPNGTYLLSGTLDWGNGSRLGPVLQGQSRDGTILRLKDQAPGFGNPGAPKAIIHIVQKGSADAFCMAVRNLTIDTGSGNPGASGLQFMANNQGAVRDVTIRSGDGRGVVGLDLAFTDMIGPCLVKNVEVRGFDIGIATGWEVCSMVFEHIRLSGQRKFGFLNAGQCVSIRGLVSDNEVPAVVNKAGTSFLVLVDSVLTGTKNAENMPAIVNDAHCFLRNVRTPGYGRALESSVGTFASGGKPDEIEEFVSLAPIHLFPTLKHSLGLPVRETPEVAWGDPKDWANVQNFGADTRDDLDDTEAIQKAIDSGAKTVYFPHPLPAGKEQTNLPRGSYRINGTVRIRGNVERIIGGGGYWLMLSVGGEARDGVFILEEGTAPVVIIEDFNIVDGGAAPVFRHRSGRTLVMRHVNSIMHHSLYHGDDGAGPAFFEDVASHFPIGGKDRSGGAPNFHFGKGQKIWARQFNPEKNITKILNDGADFWVLGLKTEVLATLLENRPGARTEILGGLNYPSLPGEGPQAAFRILGGQFTAAIGEAGFHRRFDTLVEETHAGETKVLKRGEVPGRSGGSLLPLYCANRATGDIAKPPTVREVKAAADGPRAVELSWRGEGGADGLGEYVVYRDGQELGRTRTTRMRDVGLTDATRYVYAVEVLDQAAAPRGRIEAAVTTPADQTPPKLTEAVYQGFPSRVELGFDKPVNLEAPAAPVFALEPATPVLAVEPTEDTRRVRLLLDPAAPPPLRLTARGVVDRARKPNAMAASTLEVAVPVQPRPILRLDLAGSAVPAGVWDDSAWNQGAKAALSMAAEQKALRIGIARYAQVVLGPVPVEGARAYRMRVVLRSAQGEIQVSLQVRKKDQPYTIHGGRAVKATPKPLPVEFDFTPTASDPTASLYLVTSGEGDLLVETAQVLALPTEEELAAPVDKTPPTVLSATAFELPARLEVVFSEPVAAADAQVRERYRFTPDTAVGALALSDDGRRVTLHLDGTVVPPSALTITDMADRAPRPNRLDKALVEVRKAPTPLNLLQQDFESGPEGAIPAGIMDNSAWNQGAKAALSLVKGPDGRALGIGVDRYAQIVLGRISVKKGRRYGVSCRLASTEGAPQPVVLQIRQWGAPFKTWGLGRFVPTPVGESCVFAFVAEGDDPSAALYLETQGKWSLQIDDLRVAEQTDESSGAYPFHTLAAPGVRALVYLPDERQGYYRGQRFDHAGMVGQLEHGGHTYFGELIQPHDPERHDGVAGPAEEFGMKFHPPLGYDQAAPGEPFVKIGVGVLKRKDDKPYTFFGRYEWVKRGTWTVEKNADSIKFLQELTHGPYGYRYEKRVVLSSEAPQLRIEHRLKNTGTAPLVTDYYNHNMLVIDGAPVDKSYRLAFPAPYALAEDRNLAKLGVRYAAGALTFDGLVPANDSFTAGFTVPSPAPSPLWSVSRRGAVLEQVLDWSPAHFEVYGQRAALCPEPFLDIQLQPGESKSWTTAYACRTEVEKR